MGFIDINLCIAFDGTYLYGFAEAPEYDMYRPLDLNAPTHIILMKSAANPTSYRTAGWEFVASVPNNNTMNASISPDYLCRIDSRGVAILMAPQIGAVGSKDPLDDARGIQWDPMGTNTIANATGSGGWSILKSDGSTAWHSSSPSALATLNSQQTIIYKDYTDLNILNFAVLDPITKTFNHQSTMWDLQTLYGSNGLAFLAVANGMIYMAGSYPETIIGQPDSGILYLATMPLSTIGPMPSSLMKVSNWILPGLLTGRGCYPGHGDLMTVLGYDTYILCTVRGNSTIYHHDGNNWTTPIVMPSVPWLEQQGGFARTPSGDIWAYLRDPSDMYPYKQYSIPINGSSTNWTLAVDPAYITQTFGVYNGSILTHSPTPLPTQAVSSGIGISGGAIAGIIVGALAAIFVAIFVVNTRRKKSRRNSNINNNNNNNNEVPEVSAVGGFQGNYKVDTTYQEGPVPVSVAPNFVTPMAHNTQYAYPTFDGTQSYPVFHQQQVPMPSSTLPTSQSYAYAQPYSTAPSPSVHPSQ
ncbi:hypothetical protein BGX26_000474 [Mortierella sp. AD094]|nr:hypothetical protein BGX26_000474 [Mortierella sp. AD094]